MGPEDEPAPQILEAREPATDAPLARGREVLVATLPTLSLGPGVYRMLGRRGEALYVGKARSLKKRVATYTQLDKLPRRLQRMVAETAMLEVMTTHTEVEALLLESNLIKRLQPRYNVLLRDDKSFPYILITANHDYPQILKHRGAQTPEGSYFGPFASAGAVNRTITALEKAFLLRSCSDSVFAARARPCLMYQIKRCSAPCVGRITQSAYSDLVQEARGFLTGERRDVQQELASAMQVASERLDFETAAVYRDRIRALTQVQAHQDINVAGMENADVIAAQQQAGQTCVQVFFFRAGRNYGNKAYFPQHHKQLSTSAVLTAFLGQFYEGRPAPRQVLISDGLHGQDLLAEALTIRAGHKVNLHVPQRGEKRKLIEHALANARDALARRLAESSAQRALLEALAERFGLEAAPERIEVYDNSHIQGEHAYGAMIVAGAEGLRKTAYRRFSIRGDKVGREVKNQDGREFTPGDDYAMMQEVLTRRFSRALKEDPERSSDQWPDLLLIDGGAGQLSAALAALDELGLGDLVVAAIAKGPNRDAGREKFHLPGRPTFMLDPNDPVLYLLQRLRDEAHRFAIESHRRGRGKTVSRSVLDEISGIGAKRKKALLLHFGSASAVARAGLADLESVEGINKTVAKKVYDHFHGEA